jgi:hypothetical protein
MKDEKKQNQVVELAAIKYPPPPDTIDGDVVYRLEVVTTRSKLELWRCTREVYNMVKNSMAHMKMHVKWIATIDPDSGLVVNLTEKSTIKSNMTRAHEESRDMAGTVLINLMPDGTSEFSGTVPAAVDLGMLREIQDAVMSHKDAIRPGTKLGRFMVIERREPIGRTEIYVDPMPRTG